MFNDLTRFYNFFFTTDSFVQTGSSIVLILGQGSVKILITKEDNSLTLFTIYDVAYCVNFVCNLISLNLLKKKEINWNSKINLLFERNRRKRLIICTIFWIDNLSTLKNEEFQIQTRTALSAFKFQNFMIKKNAHKWHQRFGYSGLINFQKIKTFSEWNFSNQQRSNVRHVPWSR